MNDSVVLLSALAQVWHALPSLIGERWEAFEAALLIRLRALEAASLATVDDAADAFLALFDEFPAAREELLKAYSALAPGVERAAAKVVPPLAGGIKHARYLEIPIFYATDRAPAGNLHVDPFFTGDRALVDKEHGPLSVGVVRVAVPDDHRTGAIEKPKWWKLQFREDPEKFVVVLGVELLGRDLFVARARQTLERASLSEVLIFIHGYKVSFTDAASRAAQIAYDLQFGGLTMLYSWASEGAYLRYPVDRGNAIWSLPRFREFLTLALTELGAASVHTIAHSMGNEVLVNGLAGFDISRLPPGSAELTEVILAAPDIDAGQFRDLARQFCQRGRRRTLYASSRDMALLASQKVQKYPRAGQSGDGLVVVDGVDTIDATALDTGLISHSYIGDHSSILADVHSVIQDAPPDKRFGLAAVDREDGRYWMFVERVK